MDAAGRARSQQQLAATLVAGCLVVQSYCTITQYIVFTAGRQPAAGGHACLCWPAFLLASFDSARSGSLSPISVVRSEIELLTYRSCSHFYLRLTIETVSHGRETPHGPRSKPAGGTVYVQLGSQQTAKLPASVPTRTAQLGRRLADLHPCQARILSGSLASQSVPTGRPSLGSIPEAVSSRCHFRTGTYSHHSPSTDRGAPTYLAHQQNTETRNHSQSRADPA